MPAVDAAAGRGRVRVTNTGPALAFQVRLKLSDTADGRERLPVHWDDNYFALLPGESREVAVSFPAGGAPVVEAEAWNAPAVRR